MASFLYRQRGQKVENSETDSILYDFSRVYERSDRMTREEARDYCKGFIEQYLQEKGINTRHNFKCLNPDHTEKNPSMGLKNNNCHCFSCNASYDIFDLIALDNGYQLRSREAMEATYRYCGVSVEGSNYTYTQHSIHKSTYTTQSRKESGAMNTEAAAIDITAEVDAAHKGLYTEAGKQYLDYLHSRGLTDEIIKVYKLGYDSEGFNHILARYPAHRTLIDKKGVDHSKGLYNRVIPVFDEKGRAVYFTSEIGDRTKITDFNRKYLKPKGLTQPIFNERYLKADTPETIYICEGIYTALSVEVAGEKAIALQGIGKDRLYSICREYQPKTKFIIAADNDPAGRSAAEQLKAGLQELGYLCIIKTAPSIPGKEKSDYNDYLISNREGFISFIGQSNEAAFEEAAAIVADTLKAERAELEAECTANYINGFLKRAASNSKRKGISTGFKNLDEALSGGLYEGLYVIGAISGAGKIADNIAAAGEDVLIFALEMSRDELIARSLSRISLLLDLEKNGSSKTARDHLSIRMGDLVGDKQKQLVVAAVEKYAESIGEHIYINEGVGDIDIAYIADKVKRHIRLKGKPPVIIVDYLQILAPDRESENKRATDKQITDKAVLELKRLSRDYHIPVISISSFNRDNYNEPINLASFKESGAIEYTATAVMGLQFPFMEYSKDNKGKWEPDTDRKKRIGEERDKQKAAKRKGDPLSVQCKMCKYRDGAETDTYYDFYPRFMYYKEAAAPTPTNNNTSTSEAMEEQLEGFEEIS